MTAQYSLSSSGSPRSYGSDSVISTGKKMKNVKREFRVEDSGNGMYHLDAQNLTRAERDAVVKILMIEESCSKTLTDQVDRKDEIEKLISRFESSQFGDVPVTRMRHIIPQLLLEVYADQFGTHVRKVKGIWNNRPADWPSGVKYVDPNNKMVDEGDEVGRKPTKEVLLPMLLHLLKEYMKKYPVRKLMNSSSGVEVPPQQVEEDEQHVNCLQEQLKRVRCKSQRLHGKLNDGQLASVLHSQELIQKHWTRGSLSDDNMARLIELAHEVESVLDVFGVCQKLPNCTKAKLRHIEELCRNLTLEQDSKADLMMQMTDPTTLGCGPHEAGNKSCSDLSEQGPEDMLTRLNIKMKGSTGTALWVPTDELGELDLIQSSLSDTKEQEPWGSNEMELDKKVAGEQSKKLDKSGNVAEGLVGDGNIAKQLNINVEKRPIGNVDWTTLIDEVRVGDDTKWLSSVDMGGEDEIFGKLSKTLTMVTDDLPELDAEMVSEELDSMTGTSYGKGDYTEMDVSKVISLDQCNGSAGDARTDCLDWCPPWNEAEPFQSVSVDNPVSTKSSVIEFPTHPIDLNTEMAFSPSYAAPAVNPLSPTGEVTGTFKELSLQQIPLSFFDRLGGHKSQVQHYACDPRIPGASHGKRAAAPIPTMVEHEGIDDDIDMCFSGKSVKKVRLDH